MVRPLTLNAVGAIAFGAALPLGVAVPLLSSAEPGERVGASGAMMGVGMAAAVGSVFVGAFLLSPRTIGSLRWVVNASEQVSVRLAPGLLSARQRDVAMLLGAEIGGGLAFGGALSLATSA